MENRKVVKVQMSFELLASFLKGDFEGKVVKTDVPSDLRVVAIEPNFKLTFDKAAMIYCTSKVFEDVPEGGIIPEIVFEYQIGYGGQ